MIAGQLYVNGRFFSQAVTGVQRYARELTGALDRLLTAEGPGKHEVTVVAPRSCTLIDGFGRMKVERVGRQNGHAWEQIELPWHARHGTLMSFANTGPLLHPRQIVTIHDASVFAVPETYSKAFRAWYRLLLPQLGRAARMVVTDSMFSRNELSRLAGIPQERIHVVPGGCDHILSRPANPRVLEEFGLFNRRYVLAVGSHRPHKNLDLVVRAMECLGTVECALVIVGAQNARVFADQTPAAGALSVGRVDDAELRALLEHATCLVFPSRYEGFGLPPLEAMACGCPTIVARAASLPEVCGDAAIYVDPADARGLAQAIRQFALDDAIRQEYRRRGFERAQTFRWERAAREILDLAAELE
ncbi:MAG TPA: glycosyltransferase family 1 protein [Gemmatimonadaceae bacterium]|nr:glycosyltransferase family 1 protein [Gemmatimonadaceae bacterium]